MLFFKGKCCKRRIRLTDAKTRGEFLLALLSTFCIDGMNQMGRWKEGEVHHSYWIWSCDTEVLWSRSWVDALTLLGGKSICSLCGRSCCDSAATGWKEAGSECCGTRAGSSSEPLRWAHSTLPLPVRSKLNLRRCTWAEKWRKKLFTRWKSLGKY